MIRKININKRSVGKGFIITKANKAIKNIFVLIEHT